MIISKKKITKKLYPLAAFSLFVTTLLTGTTVFATEAQYVSTGKSTTCAVVDNWAKCWGSNDHGQVGNGKKGGEYTSPVPVSSNKATLPAVTKCGASFFGSCLWRTEVSPSLPASAMAGSEVTKISVGSTHSCALANAAVYCWGDNGSGQLGNRTTARSLVPVAVDQSGSSALVQKEIIDVSAGDGFTCALASDGKASCWGKGENGRLGNNGTTNKNYPVAIYDSGSLQGKKGIRLAKASGKTMCMIAVDSEADNATGGSPYCWGMGIDGGQVIPAGKSDVTACGKSSPTVRPSSVTTKTTIFESKKPTLVSGATISDMDSKDYTTGLGQDSKAYYWGMYGYQERIHYEDTRSCQVNPCTGRVTGAFEMKLAGWRTKKDTRKKTGPVGSRGDQRVKSVKGGSNKRTTTYRDGSQKVETNEDNKKNCDRVTHYGYTKRHVNVPVGKKVAVTSPSWPQSQTGIKNLSGNAFNGLFCATTAAQGTRCDAHGTSSTEGQTGSGYAQTCKWALFTQKCSPPVPVGPQTVASSGWLSGRAITQLSTGSSGYTCAVASGSIGCWGVNSKGQLGTNDKAYKNVPTEVGL